MARKAFALNDAVRERVRYLAGVGLRQNDIAKMVGCSPKTLRKRLRDDLDRGVAEANATVSGYLFASAKAGNVAAQIFWLKTRAHWREQIAPDDPVPGSDAEANSPVVLVLPDNSRDPELTEVLREAQEEYFARKPRRQPPETRTQLERGPMHTENTVGTLPDSDRNPLPGGNEQTASTYGT
jgi:DNA-binding Lrp family transcriptional regulator